MIFLFLLKKDGMKNIREADLFFPSFLRKEIIVIFKFFCFKKDRGKNIEEADMIMEIIFY